MPPPSPCRHSRENGFIPPRERWTQRMGSGPPSSKEPRVAIDVANSLAEMPDQPDPAAIIPGAAARLGVDQAEAAPAGRAGLRGAETGAARPRSTFRWGAA